MVCLKWGLVMGGGGDKVTSAIAGGELLTGVEKLQVAKRVTDVA
jgi:hypothetical protein